MSDFENNDRTQKLQDAIGMIDDSFVEEALAETPNASVPPRPENVISFEEARKHAPSPKKAKWKPLLAVAAGIAGVAVVGVIGNTVFNKAMPDTETVNVSTSTENSDTAGKNGGDELGWGTEILGDADIGADAVDGEPRYSIRSEGESATFSEAPSSSEDSTIDFSSVSAHTAAPEAVGSAEAFVLTAGVWDDNLNRPFFENLVNSGKISFPSYNVDPRNRVHVRAVNGQGEGLRGRTVVLENGSETVWRAVTDKDGNAYLYSPVAGTSLRVRCDDASSDVSIPASTEQQGSQLSSNVDVELVLGGGTWQPAGVQAMFILDTTGSMSDELAYLQKDFASIAQEASSAGQVFYSANFYRDEGEDYVVKTNGFTDNVEEVKSQLLGETAQGGGDAPEAVGQALAETLADNPAWDSNYAHIAFLIFDAPPHGYDSDQVGNAVRIAAEKGIKLVPVVASNADRDTELFGRAIASCTGAPYVFLTDDSGVGDSHLEPIVGDYTVEKLHNVIVRLIRAELE